MKIKQIELEVWEPHPEKKGIVRFVKCRKMKDVFAELNSSLKENGILPEEYFLLSYRVDDNTEVPCDASVRVYTRWGGNEGIYIDVDFECADGKTVHFATGKSLDETSEAFDRMNYIAGFIYKSFAGEGYSATRHHLSGNLQSYTEQTNALESLFHVIAKRSLYGADFGLYSHLDKLKQFIEMTEKVYAGEKVEAEEIKALIDAFGFWETISGDEEKMVRTEKAGL